MCFVILAEIALHVVMRITRASGEKENGIPFSKSFNIYPVTINIEKCRREFLINARIGLSCSQGDKKQ